jgi:hypothetical protein
MKLTVLVGPYAQCVYENDKPDIDRLSGGRLVEIGGDRSAKVVWVASNLTERSFRVEDDSDEDPRSIDEAERAEDLAWFKQTFAADLAKIESACKHAPEVHWGVHVTHW